jgi:hypothetical protein
MQSKERSIFQSLAANSAFIAVLVIAVSEVLALLRSMRLLPAKPGAGTAQKPAEAMARSNTGQRHGLVSRYQNRRGEKASRRRQMFRALQQVDARGRRERRAMRGRRASDFVSSAA